MKNLFLTITVMFSLMGCMSYYKVQRENQVSKNTFDKFNFQKKYLIVHSDDFAWHIADQKISPEAISGMLTVLPANRYNYTSTKIVGGTRYKNTVKHDESYVLDEVHLYLNGTQFPGIKTGNNIAIPYSEIIKTEVYTKDKGKTNASWLIPGIGIPVVVIVIAAIILSSHVDVGSINYGPL